MTTTARTNINGQTRETLSSELDRLDGILEGLDSALTGAVQEAVEQAVKQAVQAVLTEVLTNRPLQQELQRAAESAQPPDEPTGKQNMPNRIWQATTASWFLDWPAFCDSHEKTKCGAFRSAVDISSALYAITRTYSGVSDRKARADVDSLASQNQDYTGWRWMLPRFKSSRPDMLCKKAHRRFRRRAFLLTWQVFSLFKRDSLVVFRNRSAKIIHSRNRRDDYQTAMEIRHREEGRMTHENLPRLLRRKQR